MVFDVVEDWIAIVFLVILKGVLDMKLQIHKDKVDDRVFSLILLNTNRLDIVTNSCFVAILLYVIL